MKIGSHHTEPVVHEKRETMEFGRIPGRLNEEFWNTFAAGFLFTQKVKPSSSSLACPLLHWCRSVSISGFFRCGIQVKNMIGIWMMRQTAIHFVAGVIAECGSLQRDADDVDGTRRSRGTYSGNRKGQHAEHRVFHTGSVSTLALPHGTSLAVGCRVSRSSIPRPLGMHCHAMFPACVD